MDRYELAIVLPGGFTPAKKKAALKKITDIIGALGGKVLDTDDWGKKDLAYPINKNTTGIYLILGIELSADGAKGLAPKLRLEEDIIRHLLIKK